jgi:AAA+ superfamily predicted ATPase
MIINLFETVIEFPDTSISERYHALVGLDAVKNRIEKEAQLLFQPTLVDEWSSKHHRTVLPAVELLKTRPPLYIFGGDVGTGKTELGSTFGDAVARKLNIPVSLYSLTLKTRGGGMVGEITKLISEAFQQIKAAGTKLKRAHGNPGGAIVFLIDEADSLAQSREFSQMHHEDRAGVNALIRGVDDIRHAAAPCMIVMCTNRLHAIDPAVQRRAAAIFEFVRPSEAQLEALVSKYLKGTQLIKAELAEIAVALSTRGRKYGYTFSDVTQRYLPTLLLAAYPDGKITKELALRIAKEVAPTPPFNQQRQA